MQEDANKKQRSRVLAASEQAAERTIAEEAAAATAPPTGDINTVLMREYFLEDEAEGTSFRLRSNMNNDDNNGIQNDHQPERQPADESQPPHPDLVELQRRCKASIITMHVMRLGPLKRMGLEVELKIAVADTCADIRKFGVIDLEDKARCVRNFMDKNKIVMHVCGTCGKRCPSDVYKEICLTALPVKHWIRVPPKKGLRDRTYMHVCMAENAAAGEAHKLDGTYTNVEVARKKMHNMINIDGYGGGLFHIIPEGLYENDKVRRYAICARDVHLAL